MTIITLLGCGKMGTALLRGWLASGMKAVFHVVEPYGLPQEFAGVSLVHHHKTAGEAPASDVYILAVKPQMMDEACRALKAPKDSLILSIAAGQTIPAFEARFGTAQPIIRTMPNTPAAIGKGITVAVANAHVKAAQKDMATQLLHATGQVEWADNETLMDAVTAVSGSGPAYVFLLIEAMGAAGVKAGLPADLAMKLARQTVIGAAALAEADQDVDAATLRKNVTSPGGTTEAALKVLMRDGGMQALMDEAVLAAERRGKELAHG
jgi:pyrroline-5-carboxylate reductase